MQQNQLKTLTPRKLPETFILVLDAALINSDTNLADTISKIAPKGAKIVFVGDTAEQAKSLFPNMTNIETISFIDLKKNASKYNAGKTHCYINADALSIMLNTALTSNGFTCVSVQPGNLSSQLNDFYVANMERVNTNTNVKKLPSTAGQAIGSLSMFSQPNPSINNTTPPQLPPFPVSLVEEQQLPPPIHTTASLILVTEEKKEEIGRFTSSLDLPPFPTATLQQPDSIITTTDIPQISLSEKVVSSSEKVVSSKMPSPPNYLPLPPTQVNTHASEKQPEIVNSMPPSILPPTFRAVKGIVLEEYLLQVNPCFSQVWDFIVKANEKGIPVIVYCESDTTENSMFQWCKSNASWIKTATQSDFKKVLADENVKQNDCLCLSLGESDFYNITKSKINYNVVDSSTDFDFFFSPSYHLPINLAELYPETDKFIKNLSFKWVKLTTRRVGDLPALNLNADGCLTIKKNDESSSETSYKNLDELNKMLKSSGFDIHQGGYNLNVKLVMGESPLFTQQMLLKLQDIEIPTLFQYCCSEDDDEEKLTFYIYGFSNEGHPHLTKLVNKNNCLTALKLESGVLPIPDKKTSIIHQEIVSATNIDSVNLWELYKELCLQSGLNFDDVWSRVKYPMVYKVCGFLQSKLVKEGEAFSGLSVDADGILQITVSKKVQEDMSGSSGFGIFNTIFSQKRAVFQDEYLDDVFEATEKPGVMQVKCKNIEDFSRLLSYVGLQLEEKDFEKLYRELCQRDRRDFHQIWNDVKPSQSCTQQ